MKKQYKIILKVLTAIFILGYLLLPYPKVELSGMDENTMDHYMLNKMEELRIPGAAIGIVNGSDVFMKGYGQMNTEGVEMTPQTAVLLGSTTKSITALAIMQLVEKGKLEVDDPVIKYLPSFTFDHIKSSSNITIRQLLNQNSGIAGPTGGSDYLNETQTASEFVSKLKYSSLSMNPGEDYQYAEANYIILGQIVEAVTGQSYAAYVKENIFKPLNMLHSYTTKEEAQLSGLSDGYRTWFGFPVKADLPHPRQYLSASGLYSSVEDLVHYVSMYFDNGTHEGRTVISNTLLQEITKPAITLKHPVGYSYGMGWFVGDSVIMHDGRPTNYYSVIIMDTEKKHGVVLLANVNNRLITAEYMMPMVFEIMNSLDSKDSAVGFFGFRQIYRVLNLLLFVMLAMPLYRFIMIIREIHQNTNCIKLKAKKMVKGLLPEIINFAVVFGTLLWLLKCYGVSLKIAYLGQPDIVLVIIATLVLTSINIILKLLLNCKLRSLS